MKGICSGCQNDTFIQNKKHNLCGGCVFKKSHGGKSKQEIYNERAIQKTVKKFDVQPQQFSVRVESGKLHSVSLISSKFRTEEEQERIERDIQAFKDLNNQHHPGREMVKKMTDFILHIDEEAQKNIRNQDEAERREKEEQSNVERFLKQSKPNTITLNQTKNTYGQRLKIYKPKKSSKPIKQISSKQAEINRLYKLTCIDMDYITEPVCTGCLKYQGGDIKLSHSHIISREDCKRIGREDLVSDRENLTYHCLDFGENTGCHRKHENPVQRRALDDYKKNMEYIKSISEELYQKYIK